MRPPTQRTIDDVKRSISGPGHKSKTRNFLTRLAGVAAVEKGDLEQLADAARGDALQCKNNLHRKGVRSWTLDLLEDVEEACGFTYCGNGKPGSAHVGTCKKEKCGARHKQFAVMLDHAARRVSMWHSWIKRAELQRCRFEEATRQLDSLKQRAPGAVRWLSDFCRKRSELTGAEGEFGYLIRKRAISGWRDVVIAWASIPDPSPEERVGAVRQLQSDAEKFGDSQLFEALAADEATCVWQGADGQPDASILEEFSAAQVASYNQRRLKVPAYRRPDPLTHPVFCDFGNSRWSVRFAVHEERREREARKRVRQKSQAQGNQYPVNQHALWMALWNGQDMTQTELRWCSERLETALALREELCRGPTEVTRADRLGRAAAGALGTGADPERIRRRTLERSTAGAAAATRAHCQIRGEKRAGAGPADPGKPAPVRVVFPALAVLGAFPGIRRCPWHQNSAWAAYGDKRGLVVPRKPA